jgi:isoquinoline 1-oxidoreductase alpha subunit
MISLTVNGKPYQVDVENEMPLLWVLRDEIGLTGTKYGCGIAECGACTVHVNGQAMRSCSVQVGSVAGAEVTTIEGLSADSRHPVQQAWAAEDVPQCGYCQSGQIMAVSAYLKRNGDPSDADIDANLTNICRCGTYERLRRAVHRAAALMKA